MVASGFESFNTTIPCMASRKSIPAVSISFTHVGEGSISSDPNRRIDSLHELSCSHEIPRYSIWEEETRQAKLQTKGCSSKGLSGWPVCLLLELPLLGGMGGAEAFGMRQGRGALEYFHPASQVHTASESLGAGRLGLYL